MNGISRILTVGGILLLAGGAQSVAFHAYINPQIELAARNLSLLQQEVPGNHLLNATLDMLRDYRRIAADEVKKRQALQLRQDFLKQYAEDPQFAIAEFNRVVETFEAQSGVEKELLTTLKENAARLEEIHSDHFAATIQNFTSPPWYFQPVGALTIAGSSERQALEYDHAHYLTLVGQRAVANSIYNELRRATESDAFRSRILFAQARLQYDAFRVEQDPEYHRQAVQHAQQSLRHDSDYALPKLFLEYLLAIDMQAVAAEGEPREGQGSGEAEGERGAISTELPEH